MTSIMKKIPKIKTNYIGRCILYYLKKMLMTPHLDSHSTTDARPEMLLAI